MAPFQILFRTPSLTSTLGQSLRVVQDPACNSHDQRTTMNHPIKTISPIWLIFLLLQCTMVASCAQQEVELKNEEPPMQVEIPDNSKPHPYGGWSCPDNVYGFPAVDLAEWEKVPVVNGRLPTLEETENGSSLMYFDSDEIPSARPLDMEMPRLARYYSKYTKKNEMVIVIQAVEAEGDSVVGFRYLNGGNGSAWFHEVDFLTEEEVNALEPTPFVSKEMIIDAEPWKVWRVLINPEINEEVYPVVDDQVRLRSNWLLHSPVTYRHPLFQEAAIGEITALWVNMYMQIDYNIDGFHYTQKFLMLYDKAGEGTKFKVIAGPYGDQINRQNEVWDDWLNKVKELSEEE